MKRLLACLLLALVGCVAPPVALASEDVDCGEVAAYLEDIDTRTAEAFVEVVSDPEWAPAAYEAQQTLEANDSNIENVTIEDVEPLLTYLSVSGEVLTNVDPTDVPESVKELHESATDYWVSMAEMMEAMFANGAGAGVSTTDELDAIETRNLAAQEELQASCADTLAPYEERVAELDMLFAVLDSGTNLDSLADANVDDLAGMGYFILFFADEPAQRVPATVSPVVIATPES